MAVESMMLELCCGVAVGFFGALMILGLKAAGGMFAASGGEPTAHPPRGTWPRRGWIAVLDQYERAVKFRFGKFKKVNNVGLAFRWPIIDTFLAVDIRDRPENIPGQICITRDNVSIKVDGVVYWKVIDPAKVVLAVSDPASVIRQATMSALRVVIGEYTLDELLSKRETIAHRMEDVLDNFSRPLGIDISRIDITDVVIPSDMQRAMAREAEAQRERRARIRRAEGEVEAVKNLAHAAHTLAKNPELLELRRLQTVGELGMEQHTLISLVLPYDYGNLGGGKSRTPTDYSDDDNTAFLDSIKVQDIEVVEANVVEEEPVTEVPPEPETPAQLDVPPAPDFGDLE
tara:strand:+ start:64 stop:1098 length:1035 start_codon:yes stop_codon:yes gene_type:complete